MRRRTSANNDEKQTLLKKTTMRWLQLRLILFLGFCLFVAPVPVQTATFARAPPVKVNVYDEVHSMLHISDFAYCLTTLLRKANKGDIDLKVPKKFCCSLKRFLTDSIDLTEFNSGNGLSFSDLESIVVHNEDALRKTFAGDALTIELIESLLKEQVLPDGTDAKENLYLIYHRSVRWKKTCVYSVIKDTSNKVVTVAFKGSANPKFMTHDWRTNFAAFAEKIKTPKKVKEKMKRKFQDNLLVHRGYFRYLFDNKRINGQQRYDDIINDVETAMGSKDGYRLSITGHSLGGALATLFTFKLAGAGKKRDTIPRPITCITFAAPFSGATAYRTAFENMERDGLIRSIRVTNRDDIVPTAMPFSLPSFSHILPRFNKHVGINIRLTSSGCKIQHSTRANFMTALRNNLFYLKMIGRITKAHSLPLHGSRIENNAVAERLKSRTLDDLYKDETIVSKNFIEGKAL